MLFLPLPKVYACPYKVPSQLYHRQSVLSFSALPPSPILPCSPSLQHPEAFEGIVKAAKGSAGEKKLAAGFITRFFRYFPELADSAMDAMLDLIEDEDAAVRGSN